MSVGILTLHFYLPGCHSLKEKRSKIKPIISRLHREFNVSVSEISRLDSWQESEIACALIANNSILIEQELQKLVQFTEATWPDCNLLEHKLEINP